jgi:hypothetical protein
MLVNIVILFSSLKEEEVTAVEEMSYAIICSIALGWEEKLMPELKKKAGAKGKLSVGKPFVCLHLGLGSMKWREQPRCMWCLILATLHIKAYSWLSSCFLPIFSQKF